MIKYMAVAVAVSGGGAVAVAVPVAGLTKRFLITTKQISQSLFGVRMSVMRTCIFSNKTCQTGNMCDMFCVMDCEWFALSDVQ